MSLAVHAPLSGALAALGKVPDPRRGVLVHVGIGTVRLNGEGFSTRAAGGEQVGVGHAVITLDPAAVRAHGLSAICPVVVLDSQPGGTAQPPAVTGPIQAGALMFSWTAS